PRSRPLPQCGEAGGGRATHPGVRPAAEDRRQGEGAEQGDCQDWEVRRGPEIAKGLGFPSPFWEQRFPLAPLMANLLPARAKSRAGKRTFSQRARFGRPGLPWAPHDRPDFAAARAHEKRNGPVSRAVSFELSL